MTSFALTSCLKMRESPSIACSAYSTGAITYFASPSACSAATGQQGCSAVAMNAGAQTLTCYTPQGSNGGGTGPNSPNVEISPNTFTSGGKINVKNVSAAQLMGCSATLLNAPSSITLGSNLNFTLNSNQEQSITITIPNNVTATPIFQVSCEGYSSPKNQAFSINSTGNQTLTPYILTFNPPSASSISSNTTTLSIEIKNQSGFPLHNCNFSLHSSCTNASCTPAPSGVNLALSVNPANLASMVKMPPPSALTFTAQSFTARIKATCDEGTFTSGIYTKQ